MKGVNIMQNEFEYSFVVDRMTVFEVAYHTIGNNKHPYFSTSANKFNRPKTDYSECGQCQDRLLPYHSMARDFWRKWNGKHLMELTDDELRRVENDVELLKQNYPYIEGNSFYKIKQLSMTIKRKR